MTMSSRPVGSLCTHGSDLPCVPECVGLGVFVGGRIARFMQKQLSKYSCASLMPLDTKCACTCADGKEMWFTHNEACRQSTRSAGVVLDVMSCHVMSCHVTSRHVTSRHVTSRHVMSCHVMSCHVMSCHVVCCVVKKGDLTSMAVPSKTISVIVHKTLRRGFISSRLQLLQTIHPA